MSNVVNIAAFRAEKIRQRSRCQCCNDGPLLSTEEIPHHEKGVLRHSELDTMCEWCGRMALEEKDPDRPNKPRRA